MPKRKPGQKKQVVQVLRIDYAGEKTNTRYRQRWQRSESNQQIFEKRKKRRNLHEIPDKKFSRGALRSRSVIS